MNDYLLFTCKIGDVLGGALFKILGESTTRFVSQVYILMEMSDGVQIGREFEVADRAQEE